MESRVVVVVVVVAVVAVVVAVVGIGGSGYVRDGTCFWHCNARNTVNSSIRGLEMVQVHLPLFEAFFVEYVFSMRKLKCLHR